MVSPPLGAHAGHPAAGDQDLGHFGAQPHLAAEALEQLAQVRGERADAATQLLHLHGGPVGNAQAERQRRRAAGRGRPAVEGVDGQHRHRAAQRGVLLAVRQVAVQHVGHRPEQHVVDRRALEFACGASVHLVVGLGRGAGLEAAQRPRRRLTPRHQPRHAVDRVGPVHLVEVGEQLDRVAVLDQRVVADPAQRDRHHVQVDRRQRVQAEFLHHHRRGRELHRPGDLELVAVEKLHGGSHPTGGELGIQAHGPQTRLLQQHRRGQPVVPGTDDDRVNVSSSISHVQPSRMGGWH